MFTNYIRTSKYTLLSFLPLNLIDQFKKAANIYFLGTCFLQSIKFISITGGTPSNALSLSLVVLVSMVKDAFEDYKRVQNDTIENKTPASVFNPNTHQFEDKEWQKIQVGNIIKVN